MVCRNANLRDKADRGYEYDSLLSPCLRYHDLPIFPWCVCLCPLAFCWKPRFAFSILKPPAHWKLQYNIHITTYISDFSCLNMERSGYGTDMLLPIWGVTILYIYIIRGLF